jgi:WD40 repeat protein
MLLALEGAEMEPSAAAEDTLRRALLLSRIRRLVPRRDAPPRRPRLSVTTPRVSAVAQGGKVFLRRPGGGTVEVRHGGRARITALDVDVRGRVATAGTDRVARVWTSQGRLAHEYAGHTAPLLDVRFSPDATRLATASIDGTARIWDADSEAVVATLFGHGNFVTSVVFSPDPQGSILATTSRDGTARLWNGLDGTPYVALAGQHRGSVLDAAFTSDGRRLLT